MEPIAERMYTEDMPMTMLDDFDMHLDRLEKNLAALRTRLGPVLRQDALSKAVAPVPEASSQLRGRSVRLAHLLDELDQLMSEVDL